MLRSRKLIQFTLALLLAGLAKVPLERSFTAELRDRNLIPPALTRERWNQLGQTGLAATLGGLRSVIAVIWNLRAHAHFADQEWYELERDYELITALDPYNPFYWNLGGWHLAYNAASAARANRDLPEAERLLIEREYLEKGDAFFRRGLSYLPNDVFLWSQIANLWTSPYKRPDLERALPAWKEAAERGQNPVYRRRYLYTLAQIPGREYQARAYAFRLLQEHPGHLRIPSFQTVLWSVQDLPGLPPSAPRLTLEQIFGDQARAYRALYNYRFRVQEDGFFSGPLDQTLRELAAELDVPVALNPFLTPRQRRLTRTEWNRLVPEHPI